MSDLPRFPSLVDPSNPQGPRVGSQGYGYAQPPQNSPYAGYGAPNYGQPQYGQGPPGNGYLQPLQQPQQIPQNQGMPQYNMGYPQPPSMQQPYGMGPPLQQPMGYGGGAIPRPISNPGANSGRTNSMSSTDKLRRIFNGVDKDGNGQLSESELQSALINGDFTKFNGDTVRLMIKMFDRDHDNSISFLEFEFLWKFLAEWRKLFAQFDKDKSDTISLDEFTNALTEFGYTLSRGFTRKMFEQYAHPNKINEHVMSFDMFVQACINLKRITEVFRKRDVQRIGVITLSFEDFLTAFMELR